ncbi:major facilitator superfamily domain-containing protein [Rhodotorula diobovata]|uniref:Major facilitator superfamily domain-containing protein n=1 Tax=Rhodotorula diobovata TaxID=5288 RepID=A0A5C5FUW1_9BASI|nr:major facilitator superfamily domain-containing protein [Rhodotorula diobovata]
MSSRDGSDLEKTYSATAPDAELGGPVLRSDSEVEKEGGNLLLQVEDAAAAGLKVAKDGKTILVPQPSDDPRDPLNWSEFKKGAILLVVALAAFIGDFQSGAGIPLLASQGEEWGLTPNKVNEAGNLNVLLLGIGGLVWIPPLYFWGRLPVLFWTQLLGTLMVLGSVLVTSFNQYYVLRPLTSLFLTAGQTIGLTFVKDMFYFHEHARKIGLWVCVFLTAPYTGPLLGGFIVDGLGGEWRPVLWLVFACSTLVLLLVVVFADETWYDRSLPVQPERPSGAWGRVLNLTGVTAYRERKLKPNALPSVMRLAEVFAKPVCWVIFVIYALSFMWAVGINVTSSIIFGLPEAAGGYAFSLKTISFLYFTPLVALVIGEVFGHWANDFIAARYVRRHAGLFRPECRLPIYYLAAALMIPGLIVVGQALEHHLTVGAIVVGWGMYVVGVMIASVAITSYALDYLPSASGEVSALVNLARTMSGFSVGYFQLNWGETAGFDVSFGIQAAIVGGATILVTVLIFFGERLRKLGGPLHFAAHQ